MLSLSEAAKLSGQSKSTIWRAVNSGRLSATRTYTGDYSPRIFPWNGGTCHHCVGETGRNEPGTG